jgi:hypothetical protein
MARLYNVPRRMAIRRYNTRRRSVAAALAQPAAVKAIAAVAEATANPAAPAAAEAMATAVAVAAAAGRQKQNP